jgi:hypothetical protein
MLSSLGGLAPVSALPAAQLLALAALAGSRDQLATTTLPANPRRVN